MDLIYLSDTTRFIATAMNFVVRKLRKSNVRILCAALFLLLMLCEMGSHTFLDFHYDHHETSNSQTLHGLFDEHDDNCELALTCEKDTDHDQQLPHTQDQLSHHDVVLSSFAIEFVHSVKLSERFGFMIAHDDFRSLPPPYLPPKYS